MQHDFPRSLDGLFGGSVYWCDKRKPNLLPVNGALIAAWLLWGSTGCTARSCRRVLPSSPDWGTSACLNLALCGTCVRRFKGLCKNIQPPCPRV